MQYLLLIYDEEKYWQSWDVKKHEQIIADYRQLIDELKSQGVYLGSERLKEVENATSVQVRNGETMITDGPFAETKEQLGGYFLVECENLDQAIEIASRLPTAEFGTIEVRPIWQMSS